MAHRVLVTARQALRFASSRQAELDAAGVTLVPAELSTPTLHEESLLANLQGCLASIAMPDPYTERVLAACAPTLKLIARSGVGYDSIDLDAATRLGVWVTTTPGSNHDTVADYTMALMLALLRNLVQTIEQTRSGIWQRMVGHELRGKILGIIGTGRVGREVGLRARAFGMTILAHDLYPNTEWAEQVGARYVDLDNLLSASDVLTLHAPLTDETRSLIGPRSLKKIKHGCFLVNTARGELIDEGALVEALDAGVVAGAALDVFAQEPPPDRRLADHPHVLPTPHSAGGTHAAHERAAMMAIDEVLRVARGDAPLHPVNRLG